MEGLGDAREDATVLRNWMAKHTNAKCASWATDAELTLWIDDARQSQVLGAEAPEPTCSSCFAREWDMPGGALYIHWHSSWCDRALAAEGRADHAQWPWADAPTAKRLRHAVFRARARAAQRM